MKAEYVIIGNSAAAVGAVEAIRRTDPNGRIVIFSKERYHTYSRPLISYYNLGKVTEEGMRFRSADFYEKNSCELRSGETVIRIDPAAQKVITDTGTVSSYGKLLIAAGSYPVIPPVKGLEKVKNKLTYTTFDDAKKLKRMLDEGASDVLIVGAGLIGIKCAEGIAGKANVTCVDIAEKVLSSILDPEASAFVRDHLESRGIRMLTGTGVSSLAEDTAELSSGEKLHFDILVLASGVRSETSLFTDIGGKIGRGIIIDSHCRTSVKNIFAAGDCTESYDHSAGIYKVMALLPNAYMQGECAGANMSGQDIGFDKAIPMNALSIFGMHLMTAGSYEGEVFDDSDEEGIRRFYCSDNRLKGFILTGNVKKAGIYTTLIRDSIPLDSIDFDTIRKDPGLIAFSRSFREKALGGRSYVR